MDRIIARTGVDKRKDVDFIRTDSGGFILNKVGTKDEYILAVNAFDFDHYILVSTPGNTAHHKSEDDAITHVNAVISHHKKRHLRTARNIVEIGIGVSFISFWLLSKACGSDANSAPMEDPIPIQEKITIQYFDESFRTNPVNLPDYTTINEEVAE